MGSGVFCMPFDSFANNVFLAKGNEQQVDFFIHGYTKFKFFGSDVYLTTTHISMIIVIAALLIFAVFANRAIVKATPDQVRDRSKCGRADRRIAGWYGGGLHGRE